MPARLLLLGICLFMNVATAATPNLTTEAELNRLGLDGLQAFWRTHAVEGHFNTGDGLRLPYAKLVKGEHGKAVILVNGRTEAYLKYQELARDLFGNGYNVYLYDHRGQGLAPRLLTDPLMGYVGDFNDYVQDLEQFVQQQVLPEQPQHLYLLAHSMGGTVSALWLAETRVKLEAAVLSSPMMGIFLGPMPRWLADALVAVLDTGCRWLGKTVCYAPGQGDYMEVAFADNDLTHSETRYRLFRELYRQQPALQLGGASLQWLRQGLMAGDDAIAKADRITTPLLVLQAGADVVVDNEAQRAFCQAQGSCRDDNPLVIEGAAHELFIEQDPLRRQALEAALSFFEQHS
ncbi:alpha/beta fold hydrolase [Zobellella iuensis]|uniref:Alpha/beta fold hydrolase n=1 Tax=Zobellella iuensis TaxID=2803811 RepID=A0ABS1QWC0_9GAMM|nr:alpha/beta fold hydrolase [Zobellella iuensis]MBL1379056.1 alpha/beta fold hydrolase [Zobellella iuensis]